MIKHFFVEIYRNLAKNKVFTVINFFNLVVGYLVFTSLMMYVNGELSYDKHNENYDRIYHVQTKEEDSYPTNYCTYSPSALRYNVFDDLPEVEDILLMRSIDEMYFLLPSGDQLRQTQGYYSENSIFDIFTINILEGSTKDALTTPNSIVLSKTVADKLFPNGNAIGKQLVINKTSSALVTAVYADFPGRSSLLPSFLLSLSTFEASNTFPDFRNNWNHISNDTYLLLKDGADPASVDAKIKDSMKHYKGREHSSPYLHPLSKNYTSPNNQIDILAAISTLALAAILILILSYVNYTNMQLANSIQRAKEIGIKKVSGCSRKQLMVQFFTETLIFSYATMIIGIILAELLKPAFTYLMQTNKEIDMAYSLMGNPTLLLEIFIAGTVVALAAGFYPAVVMSGYNPVKTLKGKMLSKPGSKFDIKRVLVVTQFFISIFMLISGLIISRHVDYMIDADMGFESKNIIFAKINPEDKISFETVRTRLMQHPEIVDASFSSTIPFSGNIGGHISWEGAEPDQKEKISRNYIGYDYLNTYNIQLVKGRNFSKDFPSDAQACILNETACRAIGWDDPIGKQISIVDKKYTVVGVVKDFHPYSIHNPIPVFVFLLKGDEIGQSRSIISIRYTQGNDKLAEKVAAQELETLFPSTPFEIRPFTVNIELDFALNLWRSIQKIFILFSIVAIIMSAVGLFGLMLFTVKRRTKEIGIRKVLGCSVNKIFRQLSGEMLILLIISAILAVPMSLYLYFELLPGAYKAPFRISDVLFSVGFVFVIAAITITYNVLKAANSNPVEALRYE